MLAPRVLENGNMMKIVRLSVASFLLGVGSTSFAQVVVEINPLPPPVYVAPPPPVYVAPPPRVYAAPRRGYYGPRRRYYQAQPAYYVAREAPWIRPAPVRGTFGISGFGSIVVGQTGGVEYLSHGGGFSIFGGVEIGRVVGIEAKYAASFHNPASDCVQGGPYVFCDVSYLTVQTFGLDLKLHIPTNTRVVPYAVVGPMVGWIGRQGYSTDAIGGGFEAGGGIEVWFTRNGTLGAEVLYRGLRMGDYGSYTGSSTYLSFVQVGGTLAAHFP